MIHVIVGENATGKTLYLRRLVNKVESSVNNLTDNVLGSKRKFVRERLDKLAEYLLADIDYNGTDVRINNSYVEFSEEFRAEALKLCRAGDYLILDEPESLLEEYVGNMLYQFILMVQDTFKGCYVATHAINLIGEDGCVCYRVGNNLELLEITDEEAWMYVD